MRQSLSNSDARFCSRRNGMFFPGEPKTPVDAPRGRGGRYNGVLFPASKARPAVLVGRWAPLTWCWGSGRVALSALTFKLEGPERLRKTGGALRRWTSENSALGRKSNPSAGFRGSCYPTSTAEGLSWQPGILDQGQILTRSGKFLGCGPDSGRKTATKGRSDRPSLQAKTTGWAGSGKIARPCWRAHQFRRAQHSACLALAGMVPLIY